MRFISEFGQNLSAFHLGEAIQQSSHSDDIIQALNKQGAEVDKEKISQIQNHKISARLATLSVEGDVKEAVTKILETYNQKLANQTGRN